MVGIAFGFLASAIGLLLASWVEAVRRGLSHRFDREH
jgi:hypothetical protein